MNGYKFPEVAVDSWYLAYTTINIKKSDQVAHNRPEDGTYAKHMKSKTLS